MEINIDEVESSVTIYDPDAALSPKAMAAIVAAVIEQMEKREERKARAAEDIAVNPGPAL